MKKVSIYVRNHNYGPSCYYRIYQYVDYLNADIVIHDVFSDEDFKKFFSKKNRFVKAAYKLIMLFKSNIRTKKFLASDIKNGVEVVIIQRNICPRFSFRSTIKKEKVLLEKSSLIWDIDDNIIQSGEIYKKDCALFKKMAKKIIVSQPYLTDILREECNSKVIALPTTDLGIMEFFENYNNIERKESFDSKINLIWIGTKVNLVQIDNVIQNLDEAAKAVYEKYNKRLSLVVVCNKPYNPSIKYLEIKNVNWSRDEVNRQLIYSHIGIMPLVDNYYTRGKAGFKLVQYLAAKLPVIGSNVGYNSEIVNSKNGYLVDNDEPEKWEEAILKLSSDYSVWSEYSAGAINTFKERFNPHTNIKVFKKLLEEL